MQLDGVRAWRDAVCSLMFIAHSLTRSLTTKITAPPLRCCNRNFTTHRILFIASIHSTPRNLHVTALKLISFTRPSARTSCSRHEVWRNTKSLVPTLRAATVLTAMSANSVTLLCRLRGRHDHVSRSQRANVTVGPIASTHTTPAPPRPVHTQRETMPTTRDVRRRAAQQLSTSSYNGATTSNAANMTSSERTHSEDGSLSSSSRHSNWSMPLRLGKKSSLRYQTKEASSASPNC